MNNSISDIKTKFSIVNRSIAFYENLLKKDDLSDLDRDKYQKSLQQELDNLNELKGKYPEYYIL